MGNYITLSPRFQSSKDMLQTPYIVLFMALILSLTQMGCGKKPIPVAGVTPVERECLSDHPDIGKTANFSSLAHGVSGTATVVSDCEIEITNFNFDGGGVDVRIYGALNSDFSQGLSLSENLVGGAFADSEFSVFLPDGSSLDTINSLSVWCIPFTASFGSLAF